MANLITDQIDQDPAFQAEQIPPTGVNVIGTVHEHLVLNFLLDKAPSPDLPSLWRLAKHVVYERGPLLVYRYKDTTK